MDLRGSLLMVARFLLWDLWHPIESGPTDCPRWLDPGDPADRTPAATEADLLA